MPNLYQKLVSLWPFTIKFYALSFIVAMSIIFGTIGWGMQYKLDTIRADANKRNDLAARAEINNAITHITDTIKHKAHAIASQDETRQQFFNPAYYLYWRNNRVLSDSAIPDYLQAIELYTQHGNVLVPRPNMEMPAKISRQDAGGFLARADRQEVLFYFYPVNSIDTRLEPASGHIGFKLDIFKALKSEQRYKYIDINTLKLDIAENVHIPLAEISAHVQFNLLQDVENIALTESIERFQRQILFGMIVLYFLFYLLLSSVLSAPLRRLSLHIDALRKGEGGLLANNYTRSLPVAELEKVRISLNDYQHKLQEMHLSLNEKNDELWQLAHHDPLTGIYNRRGFEEDWKHVLSVAGGHRLGVALLLFDCDRFKAINDTYGHPVGDQVIQAITRTLQETLRYGDRLYRLGGDEFSTMFLDVDEALVLQTAERCIEAISKVDFTNTGVKEPVRISAGMAYALGTDTDKLHNLPKHADIAMYHAKRPGKNKIAVFEDYMLKNTDTLFSNSVNNLVFKAIASGSSIEMHYQPIVNLKSGKIDYYEALVRIRDNDMLIMPATIFPIIEERRLETEFDHVVLDAIARDLAQGKIPSGTGVSFNVSGAAITDQKILNKINRLQEHLDLHKLVIEVTETALITQLHLASNVLNKLRNAGFQIALDDFGSGYSSLSYLSNMPVDCVKFDISIIRQLLNDNRQSIIIENLASMVSKTGYEIIAEGVETPETLEKISQIGFNRGQGFLFGRPEYTCQPAISLPFFNTQG